MTQEDKELLLTDLCARIPYDTIVCVNGEKVYLRAVDTFGYEVEVAQAGVNVFTIEEVKPYLRPMSSMTGVEVLEYISLKESIVASDDITYSFETYKSIDWLNKHHFDYRGLIEKGLAIEAPEGMYK